MMDLFSIDYRAAVGYIRQSMINSAREQLGIFKTPYILVPTICLGIGLAYADINNVNIGKELNHGLEKVIELLK